jgi:hypothetical protein
VHTDSHDWLDIVLDCRVKVRSTRLQPSSAALSQTSRSVFTSHILIIPESRNAAATKANQNAGFGSLRIYGLLTDMSYFRFYSYNPVEEQFFTDGVITVNLTKDDFMVGMIPGRFGACYPALR